ncbi:uncharacterized protein Dvar_31810 [Desulfosarcina variabilis str. Montpellier]|uniref:hypothetical protein n=1 Tax=Desulfosarcina variabilis TaxID=2300 RepID=UPI003AFA615F
MATKKNVALSIVTGGLVLLISLVFGPASTLAAISLTDAWGDSLGQSEFTDILYLDVREESTDLVFRIDFADISFGVNGAILLDTDGDLTTGGGSSGEVTEASIQFTVARFGIWTAAFYPSEGSPQDIGGEIIGNQFVVYLPISLLPNGTERLRLALLTANDFACDGRDRVPDSGYVVFESGEVSTLSENGNLAQVSALSDPEGDTTSPVDLRGINLEDDGDYVRIRIHYHHGIQPADMDRVGLGFVSIDADGDILTGFQNAMGTFPTFGIDAYLYATLFPQSVGGSEEIELWIQDPADPAEVARVVVGGFTSDSWFERGTDWLEAVIPAVTLPTISANAVVRVNAMVAETGQWDDFPETGGLSVADGTIIPFLSCTGAESGTTDPAGDSYGLGNDNDDFVGMTACPYEEGILLAVRYADLDFFQGEAMTSIHFDVDQDRTTGEETTYASGAMTLGVEKTMVYQLSSTSGGTPVTFVSANGTSTAAGAGGGTGGTPSFLSILVDGSTGVEARGINALFTMNFYTETVYITIPDRLLGNTGGMDLHALSMSTGVGVPVFSDEIPESTLYSVESTNAGGSDDGSQDGSQDGSDDDQQNTQTDGDSDSDSGGGGGCFLASCFFEARI